jgi:hypothetical protein
MNKIITDYQVICDETNNTSETMLKNEVHATIVLKTIDFRENDLKTFVDLLESKLPELIGRYESYVIMDKLIDS